MGMSKLKPVEVVTIPAKKVFEQKKQVEEDIKLADALRKKGNTAFRQGRFDIAVEFYTQALQVGPIEHNLKSLSNRGLTFLKMGKFKDALKDAQEVVTINPRFTKGHYVCGVAWLELNKPRRAFSFLVTASNFDPGNVEIQKKLRKCLSLMNEKKKEQKKNRRQSKENEIKEEDECEKKKLMEGAVDVKHSSAIYINTKKKKPRQENSKTTPTPPATTTLTTTTLTLSK